MATEWDTLYHLKKPRYFEVKLRLRVEYGVEFRLLFYQAHHRTSLKNSTPARKTYGLLYIRVERRATEYHAPISNLATAARKIDKSININP